MVTAAEKIHPMLGGGVYSLAEAARLTGISPQVMRAWFVGRSGRQKPVLKSDYGMDDKNPVISFRDMVDAFILSQFRELGIPLQRLRQIWVNIQNRFGIKHGFCHEQLQTDGGTIFLKEADKAGGKKLVDLFNNQLVIPRVILPFLRTLDFDPQSRLANLWNIGAGVVVNPAVNFGKPVVKDSGISTVILNQVYQANDLDAQLVAGWFNVRPDEVLAAVAFEKQIHKRAA